MKNTEVLNIDGNKLNIIIEYLPVVNYALVAAKIPALTFLGLQFEKDENQAASHLSQVCVKLSGQFIEDSQECIDSLRTGDRVKLESIKLLPDINKLINFTNRVESTFTLSLLVGDNEVFTKNFDLTLCHYEHWERNMHPELLASFVQPNNPALDHIGVQAARILSDWGYGTKLDVYQSGDPNNVRKQVAAIFDALRLQGIVYVNPPASFEESGQRIRTCEQVLTTKQGTCLDTSVLFASVLEKYGFNSLLILFQGHIYVGVWLVEDCSQNIISEDREFILKKIADGVNEIVLVETTFITNNSHIEFDDAVQAANRQLRQANFLYYIDVARARQLNINPLPIRINNCGVFQIPEIEHPAATKTVRTYDRYEIKTSVDSKKRITKQNVWERKLLDISLRNNLINLKLSSRIIPFVSFNIDKLEDDLQDGKSYKMFPLPVQRKIERNEFGIYDSMTYEDEFGEMVSDDLRKKQVLYSYLTNAELSKALKTLHRSARTSLEESGASSLFLALGLLKWNEGSQTRSHFAPILLMPVELIRKNAQEGGYILRTRDEEIIFNTTLSELLSQSFMMNIRGLQPLPTDEHGVDVKKIFAIIRNAISNMEGWNVIEEAVLGCFSFNKFVMWKDIHDNSAKLRKHPIINAFISNQNFFEQQSADEIDMQKLDHQLSPADYALPIDVDSSQLEAVMASHLNQSFILHGPPGTGKSQTITNIISNALFHGKRVLFVAEKMAALEVVQNRLQQIGLEPFCLELHSNKVTKTHLLTQLQKALDVTKIKSPENYQQQADELLQTRQNLLQYVDSLHQKRECGLSLYEIISQYTGLTGERCNTIPISTVTAERLYEIKTQLTDLEPIVKLLKTHPAEHPLREIVPIQQTQGSFEKLLDLLKKYAENVGDFIARFSQLTEITGIDFPDTQNGLYEADKLADALSQLTNFNEHLFVFLQQDSAAEQLVNDAKTLISIAELEQDILKTCLPEIFEQPANLLLNEWKIIQSKWFLPRYFQSKAFIKKLLIYSPQLSKESLMPLLCKLQQRENTLRSLNLDTLKSLFKSIPEKSFIQDFFKNSNVLLADIQHVQSIINSLLCIAKESGKSFTELSAILLGKLGSNYSSFKTNNLHRLQAISNTALSQNTLHAQIAQFAQISYPSKNISAELPSILARWISNFPEIKNWLQWCNAAESIQNQGLISALELILDQKLSIPEARDAYLKSILNGLAQNIIESDKRLSLFNGLLFDEIIQKYRSITKRFQELTKQELYARLASKLPYLSKDLNGASEVSLLNRAIKSNGRGFSIRNIIDKIPNLLPKLCPCLLMSPLSAAQFFSLDAEKFDLVIFDEASQMPTADAVGAIARGNALIVVGDPKQMPPTDFFSANQDEDDDNVDIADMESILDDCLTLGLPNKYLSWHYRSKHESLIAFSNNNYYDGKLITFPSVDNRLSKVIFHHIDGIYDKGKTRSNKAEAIAIVSEVIAHLSDPLRKHRSLGVIAFSQAQQNIIEDILLDELSKKQDIYDLAFGGEEPIFIKNLENVQGDERDHILFSIGYGPDENGNVSMNFGPLNNSGGERRLNVAVSRARYQMEIFSSLLPEMIDLRRTNSVGVRGLKEFLEFAQRGNTTLFAKNNISSAKENHIAELIKNFLEEHGYKVDQNVGSSAFKVDLAVVHPEDSGKYVLGILCDGEHYAETKTTRDREVVQPAVLKMLGWKVVRVYSVDFFQNKNEILENILNAITSVELNEEPAEIVETPKMLVEEPAVQEKISRQKVYSAANLPVSSTTITVDKIEKNINILKQTIHNLILTEQPIMPTLVYKRIQNSYNIQRLTKKLQDIINPILENYPKDVFNDALYISEDSAKNYPYYRIDSGRDIYDIPSIEIVNAAYEIVSEHISLPVEDLIRLTAQYLGFARRGNNITSVIGDVIQNVIQLGIFSTENDIISINDRKTKN